MGTQSSVDAARGTNAGIGGIVRAMAPLFGMINSGLAKFSDVALALGVVAILATLIIRIEPWMMDILLAINITVSALVLLVALYVSDSGRLTALPTVLLMTTLFRLALNVSSTRLILLDAEAGEIIDAFGNFAVGGNFVVGMVIFVVLTIIQLLVIAKGSERVAEVGARFTLDAMPGKQMSIEADMRSSLLTPEQARMKRLELERESKLYGAMDGAMKFVKGDAIAGIIISLINIGAGMIIGIAQMGMTAGESARVFTLLTIGDGLVSQIPALLVSVAAGLAVTRVAATEASPAGAGDGETSAPVSRDMLDQLLSHPRAVLLGSLLAFALAFMPGFPTTIFLFMSLTCLALWMVAGAKAVNDRERAKNAANMASAQSIDQMKALGLPFVVTMGREMAKEMCELDANGTPTAPRREIVAELQTLVVRLSEALGPQFPFVLLDMEDTGSPTSDRTYKMVFYGTPLTRGSIPADKVIAIATEAEVRQARLDGTPYLAPWGRSEFSAIPTSQAEAARKAGMRVYDPCELLLLHTQIVLRRHAADLFGVQESELMIERLRKLRPTLVEAVYQRLFTPVEIAEVLQRLLREEVPVRDLRLVFESLARWKPKQKDIASVVEHVRKDLRGVISSRYATDAMVIEYYSLGADFMRQLGEWVRQLSSPDQPIALTLDQRRGLFESVARAVEPSRHWAFDPVLIVPSVLRKPLRNLLVDAFPDIAVLAYDEIVPAFKAVQIGVINFAAK